MLTQDEIDEIIRISVRITGRIDPYDLGREAWYEGDDPDHNPYEAGSWSNARWHKGWWDRQDEADQYDEDHNDDEEEDVPLEDFDALGEENEAA